MKIYSKQEVEAATLKYFKGDELAMAVWVDKYMLKNEKGEFLELDPDMRHRAMAKEIARIEKKYSNSMNEDQIYELLKDFKYFVFGGSPTYGIANDYSLSSLGNCFVIGNQHDSYGGICTDDQEMVQLMKRRGGVGLDLSHLRPEGTPTTNSAGLSSGAVSFAPRYSNSTREVAQGGGRRGALMLSMSIRHPDAEKFVFTKDDKTKVTGANISLRVDKEFMDAVKNDSDYYQTFPINYDISGFLDKSSMKYNVLEEHIFYNDDKNHKGDLVYIKKIKARELWNKIIHQATISAEPGVLFWDTIKSESLSSCYGKEWEETSTNPCGEIPLNPYDSCRLSSLNLYSYVTFPFTEMAMFNWDLFKNHCQLGQRIMDDMIDIEEEKINQIIEKVEKDKQSAYIKHIELVLWTKIKKTLLEGRRTGFGITGEGDMLAALGLKYGTKEATEFATNVHKTMAVEVYESSIQLAKERGPFLIWNYKKECHNPFIVRVMEEGFRESGDVDVWVNDYYQHGRRNISCLTIAPNGTLSILTQTTSGIEPAFELYYKRRRKVFTDSKIKDATGDHWDEYKVFHHKFVEWYLKRAPELQTYEKTLKFLSHMQNIEGLIKESPYYKATANEIDYLEKVQMQGDIQKWIDHSISVTHNLPKGISEQEVAKIYLKAYEVGCKGVTVYVDGSRSGVLIKNEENQPSVDIKGRPESLQCDIYVPKVNGKDWVVLIGLKNEVPYEVFAFKQKNLKITHDLPNARLIKRKEKGKNYYDLLANSHFKLEDISGFFELGEEQSLTRSISLNLRYNVPISEVCDQLEKATGSVVELSKALLRVLRKYVKDDKGKECPNCGSPDGLKLEGGCYVCKNCGASKC